MSDFFFVALIGGSIVIAAVGVYVSLREVRALDKRFGTSPIPRAADKKAAGSTLL